MKVLILNDDNLDSRFDMILKKLDKKETIKILACIKHICWNKWQPILPYAKHLRDIWWENLCEFRITLKNELIRINYFTDDDKLVVLNAYLKPNWIKDSNSYNKSNGKWLDKMINYYITEALNLKKQYFINNDNYYELQFN